MPILGGNSFNPFAVGGISIGVILGAIVSYSIWYNNRLQSKYATLMIQKLNKEGFYTEDMLDKLFGSLQSTFETKKANPPSQPAQQTNLTS